MDKLKELYSHKQFKIIIGILALMIIGIIGISVYYSDKFYPSTTINGIDVSGQTFKEASATIDNYIKDYKANIKGRNDGKLTIKGKDIDISANYETPLQNTLNNEHSIFSFYKVFCDNTLNVDLNVKFDESKLKSLIKKSSLITKSDNYKIVKPVSAHVEYDSKTKTGKIVKEVQGNTINTKNIYSYCNKQIGNLSTTIDLENGNVYAKPKYTSDSQEVKDELTTYNMYLLKWLTWDMGEDTYETMTPDDIKDCLKVNYDKAKVSVNKDKLEDWIEDFCLKYKTEGKTRKFKTHSGKTIKISGGDYGWRLDFDKTVNQAYKAITTKVDSKLTEAYISENNDTNKKALTTSLEPIWANTGYKKDYTNFTDDWDTKNYSEVDITNQAVYVYRNGKCVFSCSCVTGLASDPERATKTGMYYIKDKKLTYTMTGDDYVTPTKYWVRIMWTGTGYHYLNRSAYGGNIYKTRGSHGCINLSLSNARSIYNNVSMRDPVIIHY